MPFSIRCRSTTERRTCAWEASVLRIQMDFSSTEPKSVCLASLLLVPTTFVSRWTTTTARSSCAWRPDYTSCLPKSKTRYNNSFYSAAVSDVSIRSIAIEMPLLASIIPFLSNPIEFQLKWIHSSSLLARILSLSLSLPSSLWFGRKLNKKSVELAKSTRFTR